MNNNCETECVRALFLSSVRPCLFPLSKDPGFPLIATTSLSELEQLSENASRTELVLSEWTRVLMFQLLGEPLQLCIELTVQSHLVETF